MNHNGQNNHEARVLLLRTLAQIDLIMPAGVSVLPHNCGIARGIDSHDGIPRPRGVAADPSLCCGSGQLLP